MQASFKYMKHVDYLDSIDVEDIGNCCLIVNDDLYRSWYLWISTSLGITKVLEYGPDLDGIPQKYMSCVYSEFEYSETKLVKLITKFLDKLNGVEVLISDPSEISSKILNFREFMNG